MELTEHALRRGSIRAIRRDIVEMVVQFGSSRRKPNMAFEYRILNKDIGYLPLSLRMNIAFLEKIMGIAVVVSGINGNVTTVYHIIGKKRFSKKYRPHSRGLNQKYKTG
ncbi:MAG: hypothetical protein QM235_03240 [Pseudomonadota bacterium]|nr:hypothetical protein [Pseudomonadota bacterium]